MCVILTKLENQELFPLSLIEDAMDANGDGAGYMFHRDGKVHIRKGFDKAAEVMKEMEDDNLGINDRVVFHARIATHGGKTKINCHPFPVTNKLAEFHEASLECDMGLAHNGVIPITRDLEAYNDTIHFIRNIMSLQTIKGNIASPDIQKFITEYIGYSKLAVMLDTGTIWYFGHWTKTTEGYAASNLAFQWARNARRDIVSSWNYTPGRNFDAHKKQKWCQTRQAWIDEDDIVAQWWDKSEHRMIYMLKSEADKMQEEEGIIT